MTTSYFVTHPEVVIEPSIPVPDWGLSPKGYGRIGAFCGRRLWDGVTDVFGQPIAGGGRLFAFETETLRVLHAWKDIVPPAITQ